MIDRKVILKDGNIDSVTQDQKDILGTFLSFSTQDMLRLPSEEFKAFIRQFDPMGTGYYVYDVSGAFRTSLEPTDDDPEPREADEWTIDFEGVVPAISMEISGDELRDLFRQAVVGLLPYHPELKAAYDDL